MNREARRHPQHPALPYPQKCGRIGKDEGIRMKRNIVLNSNKMIQRTGNRHK